MGHGLRTREVGTSRTRAPVSRFIVLLSRLGGGLELVEVPRHVYEFIAPFVPDPVIQRTGTYRLLGSLLLYVVKRDGGGVRGKFSALKGGTRNPFFLVIKTRAMPPNGERKKRVRKGQKKGGREDGRQNL